MNSKGDRAESTAVYYFQEPGILFINGMVTEVSLSMFEIIMLLLEWQNLYSTDMFIIFNCLFNINLITIEMFKAFFF